MRFLQRHTRTSPSGLALPRPGAVRRHYRTRHLPVDYVFDFERLADSSWRVYIIWQPSYQGRDAGMHASHRLGLPHRPFVCWDTPIRSFSDAQQVAAEWANRTQRYIATGVPIERSW